MERYGWWQEPGARGEGSGREPGSERTYTPRGGRSAMGTGGPEERSGGRESWRDRDPERAGGEEWRGREDWRGGERDDWRGGGRDEWRGGGDWRGREDWRGGGRGEWRGREWRGGHEGERRPEIDPPWVEPGPRGRHRDTRGLVEWEDRGPLAWLGDKVREATGGRPRGPKGYQRSDERIHDEVCERIARSGIDADEVEVTVKDREVTLGGTVRSRMDKWRLEDVADDVFGVEDVHNGLRVRRASDTGMGAGTTEPRH